MNFERPYRDRAQAGRELAARLARDLGPELGTSPLILALPRGGVPVGYEVARALGAPLDVFIARKLGAPGQPELGIGAVTQGGTRILNERIVRHLGVPRDYIEAVARHEESEVRRRLRLLRGDRPEPEVSGRTVILVDDGLATGVTARAAIEGLRERNPRRLVLAVPVCARQTAELLAPLVSRLVSPQIPHDMSAIGLWYEDFAQVSDEEVVRLLEAHREEYRMVSQGPVD
jgi:putative phosphoribosyl transferase